MSYQNYNYSNRLPPQNDMAFAYVNNNLYNSSIHNNNFKNNCTNVNLPTTTTTTDETPLETKVKRAIQYWLDKSTIHIFPRWALFTFLLFLVFLRIYRIQGYFIVAYGLGIYLLNNFIAFLSPLEDPNDDGGPGLPSSAKEGKEFRPFARRLPEFKFWMACTRGAATSLIMTFFSVFDVPVFWPILLMYFGVLFFMTMKRQIAHMYKHKYVPISFGKHKYKDAGVEHGEYGGGMAGSIGGAARRR